MSDLSVTALYTSATWAWAKLPDAELLASRDAQRVFDATNLALKLQRGPSLPCSLVQRHLMIDGLLGESNAKNVLELAAGLSRRGVSASRDPGVVYTEVDRAPVIAKKRELLARSPEGRLALARENLRLVAGDVAVDPLPQGADFVIAEGLCMYLQESAQRALWARVHSLLTGRGGTFVFDLVPTVEQPPPGRLGRALDWTMKRFTGGAGFARDPRTRADVTRELTALGFAVELYEPKDVMDRWHLPHGDVRTQQLVFVCRVGAS